MSDKLQLWAQTLLTSENVKSGEAFRMVAVGGSEVGDASAAMNLPPFSYQPCPPKRHQVRSINTSTRESPPQSKPAMTRRAEIGY